MGDSMRPEQYYRFTYYGQYDYSMIIYNKGLELEYRKIPDIITAIDFSFKKFEGEIPDIIGNLQRLYLLNLSNNLLNGHIPSSLANLKELECLGLSRNMLSGKLPPELSKLTFLSSFNVSYNQLEGPIPRGKRFDTFESNQCEGNRGLCGVPLKKKCENFEASPQERSNVVEDNDTGKLIIDNTIDGCYPKDESWKLVKGERGDCCSWDGVECDEETNHVISLDLSDSCLYGSINSNSTLFRLLQLQSLNLSYNNFNLSQIPSQIGRLSRLTRLNLSFSNLSGQIPQQIFNLSRLISLDLSSYYSTNLILDFKLKLHKPSFKDLVQHLTNLKVLHLSSINISSRLPNLKMLDLSYNRDLKGYLPPFQLKSPLKSLILSVTNFVGELPSSFGNLAYLEELDIHNCNFTGQLPYSFSNLSKLVHLDLSYNHLSFHSPSFSSLSWVGNLTKITTLGLAGFNLKGEVPSWLMNFTHLSGVFVSFNQLTGPIPSSLTKLSKLQILNFRNNQLYGQMPFQIYNLSSLTDLIFSSNELQGSIPSNVSLLKNLEVLDLHSNNLVGSVEMSAFSQLKKLRILTLSFNNLTLITKTSTNESIPNFRVLGLAFCNLTEFPRFLHNQDLLRFLDLSSNNIPDPTVLQWARIHTLDLRSNKLRGSFPLPPSSTSSYLISHNKLVGEVSAMLCNLSALETLDLSFNNLSGNPEDLRILILRSNSFYGVIDKPQTKGFSNLRIIDLSHNNFTGKLPSMYFKIWDAMKVIKIPDILTAIDFSYNKFEGEIPDIIGNIQGFYLLNLSNNFLNGHIPSSLSNLKALECLDLSRNMLSGKLPLELNKLTFLSSFNVSYNQLEGPIPRGKQFDTFESNQYEGNKGLCGVPLKKKCENSEAPPQEHSNVVEDDEIKFKVMIVLMGYGSGFIFGVVVGHKVTRKKYDWKAMNEKQEK
ncbi:receptor-like protein 53 [Hevea brasiliensis]|uniref:receptor-like protein 53 n=1 Tax=Hevea brasiliensis TaxID=3981 RepID=UPI0025F9727B|nr:receptor-like protein 53 [Hevea brasiliensis]